MLKDTTNQTQSYVHDYQKSELHKFLKDVSTIGFNGVDGRVQITLDKALGVGLLGITHYNYHPTKSNRKRGSYERKSYHSREYTIRKRAQAKRDLANFKAVPSNQVCSGVFHFNNLLRRPKSPHVALDKVFQWLDSNPYLDPNKFCGWAEYGDDKCMHVHFLACLKGGLRFETNSHNSELVKAIQSSWTFGKASVKPHPYQLERLANYWVAVPEVEQKPYGELSDAQMVELRDSIAHEIEQWLKLVQSPKVKGKVEELKDRKKEVQKQIKQGRATWYPNNNKDNPYRSSLSGFQSKKLNVTTSQARALARLGKFSHAKLSAKALTNVNPSTGEISNGPVLATVSLFLKLNPEEVQQALVLQKSGEVR